MSLAAGGDWLRRHESAWRKLGSMVTTVLIAPMALMVSIHWMSLVVSLPSSFLQIVVALIICLPVGVTFCFSMLALVFEALLFAGLAMLLAAVAFPVGIVWTGAWDEWWVIPLSLVLVGGVGAMVTQMGWKMLSSFLMERGELESTWQGIAEILIGPRSQGGEALEDEGRILAWSQERRGIVTVWELAALLGATPDEASRDITHLLVDYGGDILVTDEGAIVFTFDWLRAPNSLLAAFDADVDLEHQVVGFPKARLELAEALRMRGAPVEA